jgi:hypothetical protein
MPLYILAGLALLGLSLDFWPRLMGADLFAAKEALGRVFEYLSPF